MTTFGFFRTREPQVKWATAALGTILFVTGMMTVINLATGSTLGISEDPLIHANPATCGSATK
jgi:hypothetical protein